MANVCKFVPRNVLAPHASHLLNVLLNEMPEKVSQNILLARLRTKVIQRVGLLFCPRRAAAAAWRYQRGFRSLEDNFTSIRRNNAEAGESSVLAGSGDSTKTAPNKATDSYLSAASARALDAQNNEEQEDDDDDLEVPEEVASVIDYLIDALKNKFTRVRWSAAKG